MGLLNLNSFFSAIWKKTTLVIKSLNLKSFFVVIWKTMKLAVSLLQEIPTTQIRILITTALIVGTVVVWLSHVCDARTLDGVCKGWEPSTNMLIFLASLAGVDVAQYLTKRVSFKGHPIKEIDDGSTSSTDISEFEEEKG